MKTLVSSPILLADVSTWFLPLGWVALGFAVAVLALWAFYGLVFLLSKKVAAIALTTFKEALAQPLFWVVIALGCVALAVSPYLSYFTFGEDIKVVKDTGLTLIMLLAIFVAIWNASTSVADEIDGRTALTLLSKPVGRWQFIIGKFLGILFPLAVIFILLGALFLATVSYKVVYDARETSHPEPTAIECRDEMLQVVPGLVLAFYEAVVFAAIAVAISTRLPVLPNLVICVAIYLLGHIVPLLMEAPEGRTPLVRFMGQFFATIFPVLDVYNVQAAVATGNPVPVTYLLTALLYCTLYSAAAMLLALIMFEDRDLA